MANDVLLVPGTVLKREQIDFETVQRLRGMDLRMVLSIDGQTIEFCGRVAAAHSPEAVDFHTEPGRVCVHDFVEIEILPP